MGTRFCDYLEVPTNKKSGLEYVLGSDRFVNGSGPETQFRFRLQNGTTSRSIHVLTHGPGT